MRGALPFDVQFTNSRNAEFSRNEPNFLIVASATLEPPNSEAVAFILIEHSSKSIRQPKSQSSKLQYQYVEHGHLEHGASLPEKHS